MDRLTRVCLAPLVPPLLQPPSTSTPHASHCACWPAVLLLLLPMLLQALGFAQRGWDRNEQGGLPQIFSAIDGTHIGIKKPDNSGDEYVNRKGTHSILMQACCDADLLFTNIYVGWTGRVHDWRAYMASQIGKVSVRQFAVCQGQCDVLVFWVCHLATGGVMCNQEGSCGVASEMLSEYNKQH